MRVGLNNFLRFISASGVSKVNQVVEALQRYREWKDYYKDFRGAGVLGITSGDIGRLEVLVEGITDETKARHYAICLEGLKKWLAKANYKVISHPATQSWDAGEFRIIVNPEVVLELDGVVYMVKLYMAKEHLSQPARRAYAWLVAQTHGGSAIPALLEVRKGKLTPCPAPNDRIGQWITGEVAAFIALWKMNKAA